MSRTIKAQELLVGDRLLRIGEPDEVTRAWSSGRRMLAMTEGQPHRLEWAFDTMIQIEE